MKHLLYFLYFLMLLGMLSSCRPDNPYIFQERWVPDYELPALLKDTAGNPISSVEEWEAHRPVLLKIFREEIYGAVPFDGQLDSLVVVKSETGTALDGIATRSQYRLRMWRQGLWQDMDLLLYVPVGQLSVPVFVGLNFSGNQTVQPDPNIWLTQSWVRNDSSLWIFDNFATETSRGSLQHRWPVEEIIRRGYGLATVYCSDIVPDYPSGFDKGVYPLFYESGQTHPDSTQWGAIAAWSWGLRRVLDFFGEIPAVDESRVAVLGHSRLGKVALWAGAQDERFALVTSSNSGCAGATLFRRRFGETVEAINDIAPHWFCDRFPLYNDREDSLPIDQHQLLALLAPRPLYVASAEEDLWTDPHGEYLGAYHASEAYALYGLDGLEKKRSPKVNEPRAEGIVGYHLRSGKHELTSYDWEQFMDFADRRMR